MHERCRAKRSRTTAAVLVIAGVTVLAVGASADVRIKRALQATGVDADARGQDVVVINHKGGHGKLVVRGMKLDPQSTFAIMLGGVRIGSLATNARGNGRARFSSRPGANEQTLGTDPRGKHLEVADDQGEDVLDDHIPDDTVDPDEVACCLSGDDETECEDRTPDACGAEGGTMPGPASCMPNPCATTPPEEEEVGCCIAGDDEGECEQTTASECAARTGVKVDTCDPNPCAPSVPGVVRCCVPEHEDGGGSGSGSEGSGSGGSGSGGSGETEDEMECEQLTADHCMQLGGTPKDGGSCDPNPCTTSP